MQSYEAAKRRELRQLCETFIQRADATEIDFLARTLAHWTAEYPKANHEEELVIAHSLRVASERFYAEVAA
jgi:hypothetical protein